MLKGPEVFKGGPEDLLRGPGRDEDCGRLGIGDSSKPEGLKEAKGIWENLRGNCWALEVPVSPDGQGGVWGSQGS